MAFDMYAGDAVERIDHHEEFIFQLAAEDKEEYPQLTALYQAFYQDPQLTPPQANRLTHELIHFLSANGGLSNKQLAHLVFRLMTFFSGAFVQETLIRCQSD